jgi:hypothetical protein
MSSNNNLNVITPGKITPKNLDDTFRLLDVPKPNDKQDTADKLDQQEVQEESPVSKFNPPEDDNDEEDDLSGHIDQFMREKGLCENEVAKIVARVTREKWLAVTAAKKELILDRNDITLHQEAKHIWKELQTTIDAISVINAGIQAQAFELFSRENRMICNPNLLESTNFRIISNLINNKTPSDPGHNLISHQIIRYVHNKNLLFTYKPVSQGNNVFRHKSYTHGTKKFQYAYSRPDYNNLFKISKVNCISCSLGCTKWFLKCKDCRNQLEHHRMETMRIAFVTALQELLPDEPKLIDIICRNLFKERQEHNQLKLLFGYKDQRSHKNRLLRQIHQPPVGWDLLLSNINKAIKGTQSSKSSHIQKR